MSYNKLNANNRVEGSSVIWLIIAVVSCLIVASILIDRVVFSEEEYWPGRRAPITVDEDLRFQIVDTYNGTTTAVIYKDTETGIKYLYMWTGGLTSGGPCITRLWEK